VQKSKVLVITLANGENELDECVRAIKNQKNVDVEHLIISGKDEFAAHKEFGLVWNTRRDEFDNLVKIDADSILMNNEALFNIVKLFEKSNVTGAQIKMLDYYSNSLISGVNAFSNKVKFVSPRYKLYPDHSDVGHEIVLKGEAVRVLEPIAWHCKNPSNRQSFFFGYRRRLKNQEDILINVAREWLFNRDDARKWALIGSYTAERKRFKKFRFSSAKVDQFFDQISIKEPEMTDLIHYAQGLVSKR
jgi:GT2 family glycosyltransferase